MRHALYTLFILALFVAGCATRSPTGVTTYYLARDSFQTEIAYSVPTNAPFGSLFEASIYIVQPGDTPDKIMARFHVTEQQLASYNGLADDSPYLRHLKIGQRLIVYERLSQ
jgi:LysM repeat protein